uniref:Uncharacterized protein n=1 Tax=Meloidogyne incognita TaxID=6306 RepID=A0A914M8L5_MELIC
MDTLFSPSRRSWTIGNFKKLTSPNSNNLQNYEKSKNIINDDENSYEKGILKRGGRRSILKRVSTCEEIDDLNKQNKEVESVQKSKEIIQKDNGSNGIIKTRGACGNKRKVLLRKLSQAALEEIRSRMIKFSEYVEISEIEKYDRKGDKPWKRITPEQKEQIKRELNDFKAEMDVHEMARRFTRFHKE